jgi:hypothetical protein
LEQFYYSISVGASPNEPGTFSVFVAEDYEEGPLGCYQVNEITVAHELTFHPTNSGLNTRLRSGVGGWDQLRTLMLELMADLQIDESSAVFWIDRLLVFLKGQEAFPDADNDEVREFERQLETVQPADFLQ